MNYYSPGSSYLGAACEQETVEHVADWQITPDVIGRIRQAKGFAIAGNALAKAKFVCRQIKSEVVLCFAALKRDPYVIRFCLVPDEQVVSGSHCHASGRSLIAIARQAELLDAVVVAMTHSHFNFGVFSSAVDLDAMKTMADNQIGWDSSDWVAATGQIQEEVRECP